MRYSVKDGNEGVSKLNGIFLIIYKHSFDCR